MIAILLFIFDEVKLEAVGLFLDLIVWLFQLRVQLLVLVGPVLFFLEYLAVIFVLVCHLLGFLPELS